MSMFQTKEAAAVWRDTAARRNAILAPATARMIAQARIAPGMRVLEIGCGVGEVSRDIAARLSCEVVGTDFSEEMIAAAHPAPNVSFAVMDAMSLRFGDSEFDAVVGRNSIMFLPDLLAAMRGVHRVLREGARFAAAYWAPFSQNPFQGSLAAVAGELGVLPPDAELVRAFSLPSHGVEGALSDAGFGEIASEVVPGESRFPSVEAAVEAMRGNPLQAAFFEPLDERAREKAWGEVARRFAVYQTEQGVVLPATMVVTAGTA